MALTRTRWDVLFTDNGTEVQHTVDVRHGDQLRAEMEASKHQVPIRDRQTMGITWSTLTVYCALLREGHYNGSWPEFVDRDLVECDVVTGTDGKPLQVEVGPTRPTAPSDSPSP